MVIYLSYIELGCGCSDRTIVGAFKDEQEAEEFAKSSFALDENSYYHYHGSYGVQEIELK